MTIVEQDATTEALCNAIVDVMRLSVSAEVTLKFGVQHMSVETNADGTYDVQLQRKKQCGCWKLTTTAEDIPFAELAVAVREAVSRCNETGKV